MISKKEIIRKKKKKQVVPDSIDIPLKPGRMKRGNKPPESRQEEAFMAIKIRILILTVMVFIFSLSGCKQNVGTPEDNAVTEETEENEESDNSGGRLFGFSCADLSDPFYEVLKDSVSSALQENNDRILVRDAGGNAEIQAGQIEEMITEGVEAVFLIPADPDGITSSLESLKEAGIPVINLNIRVKETGLTDAYIGSDDYSAGVLCAEDLIRRLPDGGKIVIVECPKIIPVNERINGFEETLKNAGFEVIKRIDAKQDSEWFMDEFKRLLAENATIDALMCGDDSMALEALSEMDSAGRRDFLVYSVGGSPAVKNALKITDSPLAGIAALSPINLGKTAVKTAESILDHGAYEPEIYVETFFIDRENIDMYGSDGWQ